MWHSRFQVATFFKSAKAKSVRSATDPVLNPLIPPTWLLFEDWDFMNSRRVSSEWAQDEFGISPVTTGSCTWARVGTSRHESLRVRSGDKWQTMTTLEHGHGMDRHGMDRHGSWDKTERYWKCTERFGKVWKGLEDLEENMSEILSFEGIVCVFLFLWPSLPSICKVLSRRVSRCNMEWMMWMYQNHSESNVSHYITLYLYHSLSFSISLWPSYHLAARSEARQFWVTWQLFQ